MTAPTPPGPVRAFPTLLGITLPNPLAVPSFAALVGGLALRLLLG
ncbi:hypothetical protein [Streptomyces sp. CBMA123]|nr:hypothetical protein [Streptomyces sp. CBMA123]